MFWVLMLACFALGFHPPAETNAVIPDSEKSGRSRGRIRRISLRSIRPIKKSSRRCPAGEPAGVRTPCNGPSFAFNMTAMPTTGHPKLDVILYCVAAGIMLFVGYRIGRMIGALRLAQVARAS